ncbi:phage DNA packaging protein C, partial [Clostridioides difficile]|uniref:phage DNA packaging protein C n=1 Tax=Clostridioides difficile TaxID=1496 RepID=UPI003F69E338
MRSPRSSFSAAFRQQLTMRSKAEAVVEEKRLIVVGSFVEDWFRHESPSVLGRDSLVDIFFFF